MLPKLDATPKAWLLSKSLAEPRVGRPPISRDEHNFRQNPLTLRPPDQTVIRLLRPTRIWTDSADDLAETTCSGAPAAAHLNTLVSTHGLRDNKPALFFVGIGA